MDHNGKHRVMLLVKAGVSFWVFRELSDLRHSARLRLSVTGQALAVRVFKDTSMHCA